MPERIALDFGATAYPIATQLYQQGVYAPSEDVRRWQRIADALTVLAVQQMLPESQIEAARKRLVALVATECLPAEGRQVVQVRLLTKREVAKALRVSVRTVDRLGLPSVRIGGRRGYRPEDVAAYVEERVTR